MNLPRLQGAGTSEGAHGSQRFVVTRSFYFPVEVPDCRGSKAHCGVKGDDEVTRLAELPEQVDPATIRQRGATGAALLTIRSAAGQLVAFGGTLVLTHMLTPRDFGVVAFGLTVLTIGNFLSDGGLGVSLIRKAGNPTVDELRTLLGFQLVVGMAIVVLVALVGSQAGTTGEVTAVMTCSLPLLAFRAPHAIALERRLDYRAIASIEFSESVAYYVWAIAAVWAGWGVWGLASAVLVRALAGTILMVLASPLGAIAPRIELGTLRSMLAFGVGYQSVGFAGLARSQGVNLVVVGIGGEQLLGYWTIANQLMQVPFWLFHALWRVSYPTMARLRAHVEETSRIIERFARIGALTAGAALVPLAASAHYLVPALFGAHWAASAEPIPWATAGLIVSGPISVASAGYLYAEGDVRTPLKATLINGAIWIGVTAALLGPVGISAVGIGWMLASWAEASIFARALYRRARLSIPRIIAVPVLIAFASTLVGLALRSPFSSQLVGGLMVAAVASLIYVGLSYALNRRDLFSFIRLLRRVAWARPGEPQPTTRQGPLTASSPEVQDGGIVESPLFLVGSERSGTTLLRLMLDHHPQIAFEKEIDFVVTEISDVGELPPLESYVEWIVAAPGADGVVVDRSLPGYPELVNDFLLQKKASSGAKPYVGATVHRNFDRLRFLWPDARYIHLVRDPRDVARSVVQKGWAGNLYQGAEFWLKAETCWEALVTHLPEDRFIELRYEDLILRTREVLDEVCQFVGVEYSEAMLDYERDAPQYPQPDPRLVGQWKTKLSRAEIGLVELRTSPTMESRGYARSGHPLPRVGPARHHSLLLAARLRAFGARVGMYGPSVVAMDVAGRRLRLKRLARHAQMRINAVQQGLIEQERLGLRSPSVNIKPTAARSEHQARTRLHLSHSDPGAERSGSRGS
jgi:O-antigen/teichoic acid export membrane protein